MSVLKPINQAPIIGPWISRIGQVQQIMSTPCSPDPEIWVMAFFHGVPNLVWGLFKPDPLDDYLDRTGVPHHKKRRRKFRVMGRIEAELPHPKGLGWAVFKLGALAQRLGWYMAIIDQATELAVHWSSMAYQWEGCRIPFGGEGKIAIDNRAFTGDSGVFVDNFGVLYSRLPVNAHPSGVSSEPGNTPSVHSMIAIDRPDPPYEFAENASLQWVDVETGDVISNLDWKRGGDGPNYQRDAARYWAPIQPRHHFRLQVLSIDGYIRLQASCEVATTKDMGILGDP